MEPIVVVAYLLLLQGVLGAFDTFVNHEWREQLPRQPWAARELALHSLRSGQYAIVFAGIAWLDWRGAWGWVMLGLMALEYVVTIVDSVTEDRTRQLSAVERINHMLLALNTGAYMAFFGIQLSMAWLSLPTELVSSDRPAVLVVLLTLAAVVTVIWSVRDGLASWRQARIAAMA